MKIAIVIVCFEPKDDFFENNIRFSDVSYIVVDNTVQPTDIFLQKISTFENVKYIANYKNLGIARALNIGCQYALDNGSNWVVTMDQDSSFNRDIFVQIRDYIKSYDHDKLAIVSPLHILGDGVHIEYDINSETTETINTMTSGNFIKLSAWQAVDKFNEGLFIDMVDIDYYCRLKLKGLSVIMLNKVRMNHNLGNMKTIYFCGVRFKAFHHVYIRKYYQVRNSLYILKWYYVSVPSCRRIVLRFMFNVVLGSCFEKSTLTKFIYMLRGFKDFCLGRKGSYYDIYK